MNHPVVFLDYDNKLKLVSLCFSLFLELLCKRSNSNGIRTHALLVRKRTLSNLAKLGKWLICVVSTYLYGAFDCVLFSCRIRVSEWITLYSYLNVKEHLAQNRYDIWSLGDRNRIRTHNHLVHKGILNHLVKLAKWLSCIVSTNSYGAFNCVLFSCRMRISEWIYTL